MPSTCLLCVGRPIVQCLSQPHPPAVFSFWHFFTNGLEFLIDFVTNWIQLQLAIQTPQLRTLPYPRRQKFYWPHAFLSIPQRVTSYPSYVPTLYWLYCVFYCQLDAFCHHFNKALMYVCMYGLWADWPITACCFAVIPVLFTYVSKAFVH